MSVPESLHVTRFGGAREDVQIKILLGMQGCTTVHIHIRIDSLDEGPQD